MERLVVGMLEAFISCHQIVCFSMLQIHRSGSNATTSRLSRHKHFFLPAVCKNLIARICAVLADTAFFEDNSWEMWTAYYTSRETKYWLEGIALGEYSRSSDSSVITRILPLLWSYVSGRTFSWSGPISTGKWLRYGHNFTRLLHQFRRWDQLEFSAFDYGGRVAKPYRHEKDVYRATKSIFSCRRWCSLVPDRRS